ncbi:unnamed protein product [Aureobasidium mustum]|uniref:Uncharacterized protein n=1 Tax=Aureobasidium mustum TaxID=2773714 RepID=A0A9N8K0V9_9PEZI|nr:unnamed protein product [Aureobasidium mustum]
MEANIVTSNTDGEWYAHVLDQSNKVRYSSMGQQSIKIALKVVLALVEQDLSGLVQEKEMEVEDSEGEEEVDYEMEVD